jgi:hypothetical protein
VGHPAGARAARVRDGQVGAGGRSHSGKALRHILESLPRDELFQSGEEELFRTAMGILGLQERMRPKLFLRRDRYGRFYSCPGLHSARPLHHRDPAPDRSDAEGGAERPSASTPRSRWANRRWRSCT